MLRKLQLLLKNIDQSDDKRTSIMVYARKDNGGSNKPLRLDDIHILVESFRERNKSLQE